jgi:hypothetical protein
MLRALMIVVTTHMWAGAAVAASEYKRVRAVSLNGVRIECMEVFAVRYDYTVLFGGVVCDTV